jgi:large subunit ribosomal protein L10
VAELRAGLRQADTSFRVVKNSLTERAADQSGAGTLKPLLTGPTALAFVRGDVASAAKAIADYGRATQLLPFKGGLMDGAALDVEQIRSLSRLPPRDVLYGQLVGVVASPVSGLVRSLGALLGGLAVALGQVRDKMQSGELQAGTPAAADGDAETPPAEAPEAAPATAHDVAGEQPAAAEAPEAQATATDTAEDQPRAPEAPPAEGAPGAVEEPQAAVAQAAENQTEPAEEPAQGDDQAEASAGAQSASAEENPDKED